MKNEKVCKFCGGKQPKGCKKDLHKKCEMYAKEETIIIKMKKCPNCNKEVEKGHFVCKDCRGKSQCPSKDTLFFIYGSLRKGCYNHSMIEGKSVFKGKAKILGYGLYSLGNYPALYPTNNVKDFVFGELYEITVDKMIQDIHNMELGAGYKLVNEKCFVEGSKKEVVISFYQYDNKSNVPFVITKKNKVESGDWVDELRKMGWLKSVE